MLYYFDEPNDAHCKQFEAVSREQMTRASLLDYSKFPNFQMPDACEVCLTGFSSNGVPVFDDSFNYNTLYDLGFTGTNLMYDATEGIRSFPTVDATIEAAGYHYGGSCEEFPHMSDSSWFHLMCHQAKPFTEELVFNSGQFDSDGVDYSDPEAFVKTFLELSDEFNSLPALVSKETSRMKHITLVLDLDETLVHSSMRQCDNADFTIQMLIEREHTVYVRQRPFLLEFLEKVSEMFEIIIFTASKSVYAEKLLDVLDHDKKLKGMWNFASNCVAGSVGLKQDSPKPTHSAECSDDETSIVGREEGLECPICWESFNIVENVPYVLWCGHTLCKNCILGLQWAVVKFPTLPVQLPLFISCPWCNLLSFRLVYRGNLKYPRKNYFLLWMVESMNGDRVKSHSTFSGDNQQHWPVKDNLTMGSQVIHGNLRRGQVRQPDASRSSQYHVNTGNYLSMERLHISLRKSLFFFVQLTAKFPLVIIFLLIVLYAIPASAIVLALYILVTILFALPSFLILYFSYPSLDWLVREIIT